ncbi:MAG: hypothetical protein ACLRFO_03465 [Alphaproteobacteria bacterium]
MSMLSPDTNCSAVGNVGLLTELIALLIAFCSAPKMTWPFGVKSVPTPLYPILKPCSEPFILNYVC